MSIWSTVAVRISPWPGCSGCAADVIREAASGAKKRLRSRAASASLAARITRRRTRSSASARITVTTAIVISLSNSAPSSTSGPLM
jgi:hypothetical protein